MISLASLALAHVLAQIPMGGITGGTAAAPWTFKQSGYFDSRGDGSGSSCANTGATCTVNVTSIGAGHILIVYGQNDAGSSNALSSVSGETWTDCTACQSLSTSIQIDVQYVLSATGGETSFTCNFNSAPISYESCGVIELAHTGTVSFDKGLTANNASCASPCSGVGLGTLAGTSEAIIQFTIPATNFISAVSGPYTSMCLNMTCGGPSSAYLLNTSSGTAPTWTYTGSQAMVNSAIAINGAAASASWTFIQSQYNDDHGSNCATTGTTCQVSISAVGAHHILVVYSQILSASSITMSSVSEETTTDCAACQVTAVTSPQQDIRYVLNATGGETTITCNFSLNSGSYQGCGVIELSYSGATPTFDNGNATSSGLCSGTSCNGATFTASTNALVVQTAFPGNSMNSVASPYTAFCSGSASPCDGIGAAYWLNTSSNTNATWTAATSGDQYSANVIVLKGN